MTTDTPNSQQLHKDAADYLLLKVSEMRLHQKAYFARKQDTDKRTAMKAEREIDEIILRYKARGYDGDRFKDKTTQPKLL